MLEAFSSAMRVNDRIYNKRGVISKDADAGGRMVKGEGAIFTFMCSLWKEKEAIGVVVSVIVSESFLCWMRMSYVGKCALHPRIPDISLRHNLSLFLPEGHAAIFSKLKLPPFASK